MKELKPLFNCKYDHFEGNASAVVEFIQYGDLQCCACSAIQPVIDSLQATFANEFKFVFRHFPITNIHPLSLEAAVAVEAAALQGKFWEMRSIILNNQRHLSRSSLIEFAKYAGLDLAQYQKDREQKSIFKKIICDFESGVICDVIKTPTFFINGLRYDGATDFKSMFNACMYISSWKMLN